MTATEMGIEPCPFCGADAEMQPWHGGGPDKQLVGCSEHAYECPVGPSVTGETPAEAIAAWNTRAEATRTPEAAQWRCFHCGEVFTDRKLAEDHFGQVTLHPSACVDPLRDDERAMRERAMFYERAWREALRERDAALAQVRHPSGERK
jgi:hypothetical protein